MPVVWRMRTWRQCSDNLRSMAANYLAQGINASPTTRHFITSGSQPLRRGASIIKICWAGWGLVSGGQPSGELVSNSKLANGRAGYAETLFGKAAGGWDGGRNFVEPSPGGERGSYAVR